MDKNLDRLLHHSYNFKIQGNSYRMKKLLISIFAGGSIILKLWVKIQREKTLASNLSSYQPELKRKMTPLNL
jgi:hypothetical protein